MQKFYDYPVTTAYHEASHALMVIESGFTFVSASIERLPDSRGRCRYRKPRNPTNSQRMALVQVKLAGVIGADACLNGRLKPFSGAYGDFVKARDLLRSLTSCPAEEKRLFYEAREQTVLFPLQVDRGSAGKARVYGYARQLACMATWANPRFAARFSAGVSQLSAW